MPRKTNCVKNGKPMFRITMVIGHDEKGNAKRKNFFGNSEKEAIAKKEEFLKNVKEGLNLDLAKQPVSEAMHTWLFEVKKPNRELKGNSFNRYYGLYAKYVKDQDFGKLIVSEVTSLQIQRYLNKLAEEGYSPSQIKNAYKIIRMFFIYATEEGYTLKNPCTRSIALPGGREVSIESTDKENDDDDEDENTKVVTFTDDELNQIKAALEGHRMRLLYLLALGTGLRKGELLGLRYSDIVDGKIQVRRSLSRVTDVKEDETRSTAFTLGKTKSEYSVRNVPFSKELEKEVTAHRARQIAERLRLGIGGEPKFIFTTETGNFIDPSNFTKAHQRLLKSAKVSYKKFHSFRHTYATKLVQNGTDIETIRKLMGHSSITITAIYFHTDPEMMERAAQTLDKYFK